MLKNQTSLIQTDSQKYRQRDTENHKDSQWDSLRTQTVIEIFRKTQTAIEIARKTHPFTNCIKDQTMAGKARHRQTSLRKKNKRKKTKVVWKDV